VVDAVDKSPLRDNTIIVLTSDHGWQMGQKDYLFKNSPWEESCRVPFVVRAPGVAKPGGVAEHPVSLIDLYPTLIDLCGLQGDTRKNDRGAKLDGHSVRPFLENPETRTWTGPGGALSMIFIGEANIKPLSNEEKQVLSNQQWSYRTERWRYILYCDGSEELYDHGSDPHEWTNLASSPEHAAVKAELKEQMLGLIGPMDKPPVKRGQAAKKNEWDWFTALDADRDGEVTEGEWLTWNRKSAVKKGEHFSEEHQTQYFADRDGNGDGVMTRKELEASMK
jgi:arylsulfatase A-like enzyme